MSQFEQVHGDEEQLALSVSAKAITEALLDPFPILHGAGSRIFARLDHTNEWMQAVFASRHPFKTSLETNRSLRDKVRASRSSDDAIYLAGRFVSPDDLLVKSGKWPETSAKYDPGSLVSASQKHCLILCDRIAAIGFCTVRLGLEHGFNQENVYARLELRSVFIAKEMRDRRLSHLLAKAVARITVAMLRQFRSRVEGRHGSQPVTVVVFIEGEPISQGGKRFARAVADELEAQLRVVGLYDGCVQVVEIDFSAFARV